MAGTLDSLGFPVALHLADIQGIRLRAGIQGILGLILEQAAILGLVVLVEVGFLDIRGIQLVDSLASREDLRVDTQGSLEIQYLDILGIADFQVIAELPGLVGILDSVGK
jgi:hypothetical protein